MPKIGITSTTPRKADGSTSDKVRPYALAVERAGGEVVLLENDERSMGAVLDALDGVVFSGGVDVDPARYGGRTSENDPVKYRPERDEFEIALVRATRERGVPTLCICRGIQVANVAFGGTLIEDIRDHFGERYVIEHRQTDDAGVDRTDYAAGHTITLTPDSATARLLGTTAFEANSMHHQSVRRVAEGFVAVGHTTDGIIEALDATFAHPFFYAVQWHPEELQDAVSARLFGAFVTATRGTRTAP